jgi:TPR repeat protein
MAIKLFTHAADKDLPQADFALGVASELGEGAPQDLPQAVKWYARAPNKDSPWRSFDWRK